MSTSFIRSRCLGAIGAAAALLVLASPAPALACACCPPDDVHESATTTTDAYLRGELRRIRFGAVAKLNGGEREIEDFTQLRAPAETYPLTATFAGQTWRLAFRSKGRDVPVVLALPAKHTRFAADIHDGKRFGAGGPLLYKELRLEGVVTDGGLFKPGADRPTRYTLVFQGRGGNCDSAEEFTHWHLSLASPRGTTSFSGTLAPKAEVR